MSDIFPYDVEQSTIVGELNPQGLNPVQLHDIAAAQEEADNIRQEEIDRLAQERDWSLTGYAGATWREESLAKAAWDSLTDWSQVYDPEYDASVDIDDGLPAWAQATLKGAMNAEHMAILKDRLAGQMDYLQQGEYFGGAGMAVNIGSMILHPETALLGIGEAAALTKLGLTGIGRVAAGAGIASLSNTGQELALMANNKSRDELGLIFAAGAGLGFGALAALPGAKMLAKSEKTMAGDYSRAMKYDLDLATGDIKIDAPVFRSPDSTAWYDMVETGKAGFDESTGKYVVQIGDEAYEYASKADALLDAKIIKGLEAEDIKVKSWEDMAEDFDKTIPRDKVPGIKGLKSMSAEGMASENPIERALHFYTLEHAAGYGGKRINHQSAAITADQNMWKLRSTMHPVRLDNYLEWARQNKGSIFKGNTAGRIFSSLKFIDEFDDLVVKDLYHLRFPDRAPHGYKPDPHVREVTGALINTTEQRIKMLRDSGATGYADADFDKFHFSHKWDSTMINKYIQMHGENAVRKLIVKGILTSGEFKRMRKYGKLGDKLTEEYKRRTAEHMADAIVSRMRNRPTRVNQARSTYMTRKDISELEARLEKVLVDKPEDLKHVMAAIDARDPRFLDDTLSQIDMDLNAELDGMNLRDLMDTNLGRSLDTDFRRDSGRAAMAKKGFVDENEFLGATEAAGKWWQDNTDMHANEIEKRVKKYQDLWRVVLGQNIEKDPSSGTARGMRILRRQATLSSLNQVGFAQFAETGRTIGSLGVRMFMKQIPAFRSIIGRMKNGTLKDPILRDIEAAFEVRVGDNHILNHPSIMAESGGQGIALPDSGRFMRGLEAFQNWGLNTQGYINGMNGIMQTQHRMYARGFFMKMYEQSKRGFTPRQLRRYLDLGLTTDDMKKITNEINKHAESTTGWFGQKRLSNMNLVDFEPNIREKLAIGFNRDLSRAVQKNLPGETSWAMESTFGKLLTQFKTFPIVAMEKQAIHDARFLKRGDFEGMSIAFWSLGCASLAYMAKTYANSFGLDKKARKKYMKNRLTPEKIGAGAVSWSGQAAYLPEIAEIMGNVGLENPFQYTYQKGQDYKMYRTGELGVGNLGAGASYADHAFRMVTGIGNMAIDGDSLAQDVFKNGWKTLPYENAIGMKNLYNILYGELE